MTAENEFRSWNLGVARELGLLALRTSFMLHSGAFVVLLTFIGNAHAQTAFIVELPDLKKSMACFLAGIAMCFVVLVTSYVNAAHNSKDRKLQWLSNNIIRINSFGVLASMSLFVLGVAFIIWGVATQ